MSPIDTEDTSDEMALQGKQGVSSGDGEMLLNTVFKADNGPAVPFPREKGQESYCKSFLGEYAKVAKPPRQKDP